MFPLFESVIAPILRAAEARRVVEIGALRGQNTALLFDVLGPNAELHVIDPEPQFDAEDLAPDFGGNYVFHRGTSLDVLRDLGAVDVALIDGDHNWHTVYNELGVLAATARAAGQPLPVLV